jgi:hypothetical protein
MFPVGLLALLATAAGAFAYVASAEYLHRRRGWDWRVRFVAWFWGLALLTGPFAFSHLVGELCLTEGKPAEDFSRFQHYIWLYVVGLLVVGSTEYLYGRRGWGWGVRSVGWFWGVVLLTLPFGLGQVIDEAVQRGFALWATEPKARPVDCHRFQHTIWLYVAGVLLVGSSAAYALTLVGHWLVYRRAKPSTG